MSFLSQGFQEQGLDNKMKKTDIETYRGREIKESPQTINYISRYEQPVHNQITIGRGALLIALLSLLAMTAISSLAPDLAYLGGFVALLGLGGVCGWIMHRAFHNFGVTVITVPFVIVFLFAAGLVKNLFYNISLFMTALQHVSWFASVVVIAVLIGVLLPRGGK